MTCSICASMLIQVPDADESGCCDQALTLICPQCALSKPSQPLLEPRWDLTNPIGHVAA